MYVPPTHILELFEYQKQKDGGQTLTRIENLQLARERIPQVFEPRLWPEYDDAAVPELYSRVAHAVRSGQLVYEYRDATWRGPLSARRESETLAYRLQENPASLPESWYSTGILFPSLSNVVDDLMYEDELKARRPIWQKAFESIKQTWRKAGLTSLHDLYALTILPFMIFMLAVSAFKSLGSFGLLLFLVLFMLILIAGVIYHHDHLNTTSKRHASRALPSPPRRNSTSWRSVQQVQRVLEQSVQDAEKVGDAQWLFDARTALTEYLPETVNLHVQRQGKEQDPEFQTMLSDIQAIGTRVSHENLQRRWESQQRFLSERAKQTTK